MRTLKKRHNPKDQGNNEPNKEDKKPINETKDLKDSEQTAREEVYENYKAYIHHRKTDWTPNTDDIFYEIVQKWYDWLSVQGQIYFSKLYKWLLLWQEKSEIDEAISTGKTILGSQEGLLNNELDELKDFLENWEKRLMNVVQGKNNINKFHEWQTIEHKYFWLGTILSKKNGTAEIGFFDWGIKTIDLLTAPIKDVDEKEYLIKTRWEIKLNENFNKQFKKFDEEYFEAVDKWYRWLKQETAQRYSDFFTWLKEWHVEKDVGEEIDQIRSRSSGYDNSELDSLEATMISRHYEKQRIEEAFEYWKSEL